ncbi:MAG: S-layer homology domain-containing protein [Firmicutes bacterium]|nr:S-layer homology domain-containing protein [Bacillota bacterium]
MKSIIKKITIFLICTTISMGAPHRGFVVSASDSNNIELLFFDDLGSTNKADWTYHGVVSYVDEWMKFEGNFSTSGIRLNANRETGEHVYDDCTFELDIKADPVAEFDDFILSFRFRTAKDSDDTGPGTHQVRLFNRKDGYKLYIQKMSSAAASEQKIEGVDIRKEHTLRVVTMEKAVTVYVIQGEIEQKFEFIDTVGTPQLSGSVYIHPGAVGHNTQIKNFRIYGKDSGKTSEGINITPYQDINNSSYKREIETLYSLNLLEWVQEAENFSPEDLLTRAEAAAIFSTLLGFEKFDAYSFPDDTFYDVPTDYWAAEEIALCYNAGIVNGYNDEEFMPDEPVKFEEFLKMIVILLGYDNFLDDAAPYPQGYINIATQKKITREISGSIGTPITREEAVALVCNSLQVDIMQQTKFGGETRYETIPGQNVLTQNLGLKKKRGQVNANSITTLTGESALRDDEVAIDNVVYKVGNTLANSLLGYNVQFYIKEDDASDISILRYVAPDDSKNDVLKLGADNIESSTTKSRIVFQDDDSMDARPKEARLANNASIIFNGKYCGVQLLWDEDFNVKSGEMTLIDTNLDGLYDVVLINSYITYVLNRVDALNERLFFKFDKTYNGQQYLQLSSTGSQANFNVVLNGRKAPLVNLKEWDVVSVGASKDGLYANIIVSRNRINGAIEEITDDALYINGNRYEYEFGFWQDLSKSNIKVGEKGYFYFDFLGKLAATDINMITGKTFGYLIDAVLKEKGMEKSANFQIFAESGEVLHLKSSKKITCFDINNIDGTLKNADETIALIKSANAIGQLILFEVNNENEINRIYLSFDNTSQETNINYEFTKDYFSMFSENPNFRRVYQGILAIKYRIEPATKIFVIPNNKSMHEHYQIQNVADLANDMYLDNVSLYSIDKAFRIGAMVVENESDGISVDTNLPSFIVEKTAVAMNEAGEEIYKVSGYQKGNPTTISTVYDTVESSDKHWHLGVNFKNLTPGDVIQYSTDKNRNVNSIRVLFKMGSPGDFRQQGRSRNSSDSGIVNIINGIFHLSIGYGKVVDIIDDAIILNTQGAGDNPQYNMPFIMGDTEYYIYEDGKINKAAGMDLQVGDTIFARKTWNNLNDVLIIK